MFNSAPSTPELHWVPGRGGSSAVVREWSESAGTRRRRGNTTSAWVAHHMPYLSDSGSDSTATSAVSDGDTAAQTIDIAWDSPWYRLPQAGSPISSSPLYESYSCACSPDVRQAMAQQDLLLDLFHEELRRIIPIGHDYDSGWLEDVDPDLVLSPVESYEELCWQSAVSEAHTTIERQRRPLPDVPVGCGDQLDGAF